MHRRFREGGPARDTNRGDQSRYLQEVDAGSSSYEVLTGTWVGEDEEHDGLSVQNERLQLNGDGTFTHRLAHHVVLPPSAVARRSAGAADKDCQSSCSGRWRLYNIRHFGADVSAPANDREVVFERGVGSGQLLTEKLVVCGANPAVNGFVGSSCRLYPTDRDRVGRRVSTHNDQTRPECELEVEDPEPSEDDAKKLADATGHSVDACLAALVQTGGDTEEAAVLLLENPCEATENMQHRLPTGQDSDLAVAGSAEAVAEATGRTRTQCEEALQKHGGRVDDAVVYLLSLSDAPSASSAVVDDAEVVDADAGQNAPVEDEALTAARLTEITGQPFEKCIGALRHHNGNTELAATALLGLEHESPNQEVQVSDEFGDARELDDIVETLDSVEDEETRNAGARAVADVHATINAEVEAAMFREGDEPPTPSPKRQKIGDNGNQ